MYDNPNEFSRGVNITLVDRYGFQSAGFNIDIRLKSAHTVIREKWNAVIEL